MKGIGKNIVIALLVIALLLALPYAYHYIKLNIFIKQQEEIINTKFIPKLEEIEEGKGIFNVLKEKNVLIKDNSKSDEEDGEYYEVNNDKFDYQDYSTDFFYHKKEGAKSDLMKRDDYIVPSMFVLSKYYNYISKASINNANDMEYVIHAWYENRPSEVVEIETIKTFTIYIAVDDDSVFIIDVNEEFDDYYEDVYKKILELM